jgi:hypothetical protein
MRIGTFVLGCAALVIACGDDGVGTTNDESSTGNPETTDPDDDGPDDDGPDDDGPDDDGPDDDGSDTSVSVTVTVTESSSSSEDTTATATESSSDTSSGDTSSSGESSSSDTGTTASEDSSTTAVMEDSSSDDDDDDSVGFIIDPDFGSNQECDPYLQDCPDGEKCNAWANDGGASWNALGCFPVDVMPDGVGESCTVEGSGVSGVDSCDVGAMCWDVDTDTNIGTCIALCIGSADDPSCADAASICIIANEGALNICLPFCDPLMQDCGAGQGCYPIESGFACAPDASLADGQYGDECEFINVCDPGLWCAPPDAVSSCFGSGCCSEFCDVSDPLASMNCPDSGDGQECVPFFAEGLAPPGFEDVGICSFPV